MFIGQRRGRGIPSSEPHIRPANEMAELEAHNRVLTEAATSHAQKVQDLERELTEVRTEYAALVPEHARFKGENAFYAGRLAELEAHNRALTEAATSRAQRAQDLERALAEAATNYARQLQGHLEPREGSLPSVLFTSIPKSGTVFTGQMLSRGLDLELVRVTVGSFPRYLFDLPRLARFACGGRIAAEHFDASPENLQALGAFIDRWVVHIRDPRSVLLSWVHHLNRLYRERNDAPYDLLYVCPTPPEEYFSLPFAEQVDWNIENFLPNVIHWIKTWVETYDSGRHTILLTTYSDMVAGEDDYLLKILDFCGIARDRFSRPEMKKDMGLHFRVGREDEWLDCLTPEQLDRTRNMIGSALIERFRWPL